MRCSRLGAVLRMALVFTLTHVFTLASSTAAPDERIPLIGDEYAITKAFINVTAENRPQKISEGRYGGGYVAPAYGVVVHITSEKNPSDHFGCHLPFRSSRPDGQLPEEPWIALIKRGKCNFEVKVDNAFKSNAAGVLVYNDRDSQNLEKMKLTNDPSSKFAHFFNGEDRMMRIDLRFDYLHTISG